jgi:malonyl-CoA O-methyltransferase
MAMEERAVLELLPDVRGRAVLDLACGSGRYLKILLARGAGFAVGLDASPPMLARAREFTRHLLRADLSAMALRAGSFHVVTCALAVGHVMDLDGAMREIARVLEPDGVVVYSDFHPIGAWLGWQRTFRGTDGQECRVRHFTHLYADHVSACAAAGLRIEDVREPRIDFAGDWRGCPAVLVIRARKAA